MKKNNKSSSLLLIFGLALSANVLVTEQAHADIFKCVDKQGKVFYNDKPCPVKDKETKLKSVVDPKNLVTKEINVDLANELANDKSSTVETEHEIELRMARERGEPFDDESGSASEESEKSEITNPN